MVDSCHTKQTRCMTMLTFRVDDSDAGAATRWADRLGTHRSELLREALRQHLLRLASENDAVAWQQVPLTDGERPLEAVEHRLPAEDRSDWEPVGDRGAPEEGPAGRR